MTVKSRGRCRNNSCRSTSVTFQRAVSGGPVYTCHHCGTMWQAGKRGERWPDHKQYETKVHGTKPRWFARIGVAEDHSPAIQHTALCGLAYPKVSVVRSEVTCKDCLAGMPEGPPPRAGKYQMSETITVQPGAVLWAHLGSKAWERVPTIRAPKHDKLVLSGRVVKVLPKTKHRPALVVFYPDIGSFFEAGDRKYTYPVRILYNLMLAAPIRQVKRTKA